MNCAGGVVGQTMKPVEEVSEEAWRAIFAVNLDGAFHFTRAAVPAMKTRGRGSIVNISSGAGRSYSLTGIQAYASAKAGLIGFTRQTARELGAFGIRVNCVAPGFVRSNPASERQWQAMGEAGQRGSSTRSRSGGSVSRRTSPAPCCSSPPTTPGTSPARRSASTGATGCSDDPPAPTLASTPWLGRRHCAGSALAATDPRRFGSPGLAS